MKRFVGFILLGVAAVEFLSSFLLVFTNNLSFQQTGLPTSFGRIFTISLITISAVVSIVIAIVGIIFLIKGER
ncbi:MAG: hypothetical protein ACFFEN_02715 [Candidatus Thorarchaeota archaeon]